MESSYPFIKLLEERWVICSVVYPILYQEFLRNLSESDVKLPERSVGVDAVAIAQVH